ncbi:hypothetical protein Scep_016628 [Stephania cephalantha]|uniref:Uncharacterized protein n=1 Tax=Stephania cephalantha TaxID=152367 RepID=A0AAP0INI9_9MAGN
MYIYTYIYIFFHYDMLSLWVGQSPPCLATISCSTLLCVQRIRNALLVGNKYLEKPNDIMTKSGLFRCVQEICHILYGFNVSWNEASSSGQRSVVHGEGSLDVACRQDSSDVMRGQGSSQDVHEEGSLEVACGHGLSKVVRRDRFSNFGLILYSKKRVH